MPSGSMQGTMCQAASRAFPRLRISDELLEQVHGGPGADRLVRVHSAHNQMRKAAIADRVHPQGVAETTGSDAS